VRGQSAEPPSPILVVDDDAGVRRLVAIGLRRAGFDVLEADGGNAALALLETEPIGVIVLDMGMPGLSGTDVVRAVRERKQTATLPIILMTGSGDEYSLVTGLGAGADDFLAKPVRLDELVARVQAHLRKSATWSNITQDELIKRSAVVEALGHVPVAQGPEESAEAVVAELSRRTAFDFIAVTQLVRGDRMLELATYNRVTGVRPGGALLGPNLSRELIDHARQGPWVEEIVAPVEEVRTAAFAAADLEIGSGAPIYAGQELVGLLSLGIGNQSGPPVPALKANLLAAAIDYASILSAVIGPALADRRGTAEIRAGLDHILKSRAFHPVFQPIVELGTRATIGFEALTRFDDGTRPDLQFAKAASAGIGHEFELATIGAALGEATILPGELFLSLNVSPSLVLDTSPRLRAVIEATSRRLILELTEHVAIDDYREIRSAIAALGDVGLAVDDAGAGYASLRHILELRPTFAKLDISLVRGIEADELRQSLVAGLVYFALRSGCGLIAEGVESEEEAAVLERLGVDFAQGFLFGRPEPLAK
jgi:EAL domain-containing protein (putative c-di-GMP-specific phosphodiesterase class I)/DNA-binding response OmpR family regulator